MALCRCVHNIFEFYVQQPRSSSLHETGKSADYDPHKRGANGIASYLGTSHKVTVYTCKYSLSMWIVIGPDYRHSKQLTGCTYFVRCGYY